MSTEQTPVEPVTTQPEGEPLVYDQRYVESLRRESAKYRTRANEFQTQLAEVDEIKKKAADYEALIAKQQEEQGQFKELYETTKTELNEYKGLKERVSSLEQTFIDELDSLKKGMSEDDIKLLDEIPVAMVEKKLQFAKRLIGKNGTSLMPDARGGSDSMRSVESMIKEYATADMTRKMEILNIAEKKDPGLYQTLLKM